MGRYQESKFKKIKTLRHFFQLTTSL